MSDGRDWVEELPAAITTDYNERTWPIAYRGSVDCVLTLYAGGITAINFESQKHQVVGVGIVQNIRRCPRERGGCNV